MSVRISQAALMLTLVALIVLICASIQSSLSQRAFKIPGSARVTQDELASVLDGMAAGGKLQEGAVVTIGVLQRNNGRTTKILVAEGTFTSSSIEPRSQWENTLAGPSMIVSSGDEHLRNDGGISRAIGAGCSIAQVSSPLPTGGINIDPCAGSYAKAFPQLSYAASAIIVAWKGVSETPNCKFESVLIGPDQPAGYVQCLQTAIESSLTALFNSEEISRVETLVLPALGTGTGGLSRGASYKSSIKPLFDCLQSVKCSEKLPANIVLLVWAGSGVPSWVDTKDAIARNTKWLAEQWVAKFAPTSPVQKQARFVGILSVILLAAACLAYPKILPKRISSRLPTLSAGSLWLIAFGWFLVAAGAFSVLSDFIDLPVVPNTPNTLRNLASNVLLGIAAAIVSGYLHRAMDAFKRAELAPVEAQSQTAVTSAGGAP